jgi:putative ABC transport system substrate-binding protein
LNDARPADVPVEFPTKFEMAVNLNAAKALGLLIRQTLLSADAAIE